MYQVFRLIRREWLPISRKFPTYAQAHRYLEGLMKDWVVEVRQV